jgi:anti-sigma factor RsiW
MSADGTRNLLLGYLRGTLSPDERQAVESRLAADAQWRDELQRLQAELGITGDSRDVPAGLAERTCHWVSWCRQLTPGGDGARWRLVDVAVAAGLVVLVGMLFFPAAARSREQTPTRAGRANTA